MLSANYKTFFSLKFCANEKLLKVFLKHLSSLISAVFKMSSTFV